jgi:hypothetical protein
MVSPFGFAFTSNVKPAKNINTASSENPALKNICLLK